MTDPHTEDRTMLRKIKGIITVLALLVIALLALGWYLGYFDSGDAEPRRPSGHHAPTGHASPANRS